MQSLVTREDMISLLDEYIASCEAEIKRLRGSVSVSVVRKLEREIEILQRIREVVGGADGV